jgi:SAM-dependent methyltransferase
MKMNKLKNVREEFFLSENDPVQQKGEIINSLVFSGGPVHQFSLIGRLTLITLLKIGLTPYSKVLDIGCGALRGGYWIIHFLNAGNYFGIEPNKIMLDVGKSELFSPEELKSKSPSFDYNDEFKFSVFDVKFDYVVARSIWTHTSKSQILKMLDEFLLSSSDSGSFLTSYHSTDDDMEDYLGNDWVGKSHGCNKSGMVFHKFSWVKEECEGRNLYVQELDFDFVNQKWLLIKKNANK